MIIYHIIIHTLIHSSCSLLNFKILPKFPAPHERFSMSRILLNNSTKHGTKTS